MDKSNEQCSPEDFVSFAERPQGLRPQMGLLPEDATQNSDSSTNEAVAEIKHIVLSGGGVTGLSFYGILRETHRNGLWKLENIQTIYGTSIGSVLAVILCLGYEWEILDAYFLKRPWQNLFKFDLYSVLNIFEKKGLFNIKIFEEMIGPLLCGMNIPVNITMIEFYEKTGIELHLFSTELNSIKSVDFSHKTHPSWKMVDVMYCSSIIPVIFEPFIHTENNITNCYVDGGFLMNYPLNNCISNIDPEDYSPDQVLGINKLQNTTSIPVVNESTFFDYIMVAFNVLFEIVLKHYQDNEPVKITHEFTIIDSAITLQSVLDTASSMEERERLIKIGVDMVDCKPFIDNAK